VGGLAGDGTDDGAYNTAVGHVALSANCGNENTAVGYAALTSATGADNTAVGSAAGFSLTSATAGVFLGKYAGIYATTADNSTFVGFQAGQGITGTKLTGNGNTAVGKDAGLTLQGAAASNTFVGDSAGAAVTTSTENSCFGSIAGEEISTGTGNTMLGAKAGNYEVGTSTGSYNTVVGSYSHVGSIDGDLANVFGHDVTGTAAYTTLGAGANDIRAAHGNVTWATVSDERYKKDIVNSTAGLSFINALQPRTFKYKTLGELPETFRAYEADSTEVFKNSNTNHGFIAQEVKTAIDADSSIKDGFRLWDDREDGSQEVAEAALIPVLTKAIQELSTQLDAALARITTLEG
jgi:hypothetical protein